MSETDTKDDITPFLTRMDEDPSPEYKAYVREKIAKGRADVQAGRTTPIAEVRRDLGLE